MRPTVLIAVLALPFSACMSYRAVEEPAQEIQRRIASDGLLASGDHVRVTTEDGRVHKFQIAEIDADGGDLVGKDDVVRIDEIIAVDKRRLSWIKTGALIGLVAAGTLGPDCEDNCGDGPFRSAAMFCC